MPSHCSVVETDRVHSYWCVVYSERGLLVGERKIIKGKIERMKGKTAATAGPATPMEAVHTVRLGYTRPKYNGISKQVLLLKPSTPCRFLVFFF